MKRILVVDDEEDILNLERRILEREGYEVITANSGAGAMKVLAEQEFDLLLLDIMMPEIDGFEVSRSVKRGGERKSVPVVFITANQDSESLKESFRAGGNLFLNKPFNAHQLARMVKALIGT